jgi:AcrR family transcriptional regulator
MPETERDTTDAILTAAADLFGERGYKATTTRAIAERAGVNEVTVFRRLGSKQGVLRALGEAWAKRMAGFAVDGVPDPSDTRAALHTLARAEVAQAGRIGVAAMRLAIEARANPEVAQVMGVGPSQNEAGLAAYLADRQRAGDIRVGIDPRVMAEGFFLLTSTLVMSRQVLGPAVATADRASEEQASEQLIDIYLDGALTTAVGVEAVRGTNHEPCSSR